MQSRIHIIRPQFRLGTGLTYVTNPIYGAVEPAVHASALPVATCFGESKVQNSRLGVGLGGDSSPRMVAFPARLEF